MGNKKNRALSLPAELADQLSSLLPERPDGLYPFALAAAPADSQMRIDFERHGIIDRKGALTADWRRILDVLGHATAMARFMALLEGDLLEHQVFFDSRHDASVSLSRDQNGFLFEVPVNCSQLIDALSDYSGSSLTGQIPVLGEITSIDALCALGMADLTRRELLRAVADDAPWHAPGIAIKQLTDLLRRKDLNSGWLIWFLQSVLRKSPSINEEAVENAMHNLENRGFLKRHAGGFIPAGELLLLTQRLLMVNMLYKVDGVRLAEDLTSVRQTFGIIQNGTRDLLFIEAADESVFLAGITGRTFLLLVQRYLTQAEAVTLPSSSTSAITECVSCGKPVDSEARFCKFCGTPQVAERATKRFCTKCGTPRKQGKKFCTRCGSPYS